MSKSSIITSDETSADLLSPVTPGELLKEEFLVPMGISQYRLAKETGIPAQRIGQIVLGKRRVTADTDLRLCRYFGTHSKRSCQRQHRKRSTQHGQAHDRKPFPATPTLPGRGHLP